MSLFQYSAFNEIKKLKLLAYYSRSVEMKIYNLKDKISYLDEVANLEYEEWADNKNENKQERIQRKKEKICNSFNNRDFCKLILLDNDKLIGFISFFQSDCIEEKELTNTKQIRDKAKNFMIL